jgi:hypothetical protein
MMVILFVLIYIQIKMLETRVKELEDKLDVEVKYSQFLAKRLAGYERRARGSGMPWRRWPPLAWRRRPPRTWWPDGGSSSSRMLLGLSLLLLTPPQRHSRPASLPPGRWPSFSPSSKISSIQMSPPKFLQSK